jgi:hypothetical protein
MSALLTSLAWHNRPSYIMFPLTSPIHFRPEDGGSMFLRKVGNCLQHYTILQPKWPQHESCSNEFSSISQAEITPQYV